MTSEAYRENIHKAIEAKENTDAALWAIAMELAVMNERQAQRDKFLNELCPTPEKPL